jgi:hypothetical protein
MLGRRLLVLMAVLLGLTALAAALAPRPTVVPQRGGLAASPTPAATTPAPASEPSRVVAKSIGADEGAGRGGANLVRAREGDTVRLTVHGDVLDTAEIEGVGQVAPLEPGSPAHFEFTADEPGKHAIVLQEADRKIGELDVRPAAG